jgi:hypothetical protein
VGPSGGRDTRSQPRSVRPAKVSRRQLFDSAATPTIDSAATPTRIIADSASTLRTSVEPILANGGLQKEAPRLAAVRSGRGRAATAGPMAAEAAALERPIGEQQQQLGPALLPHNFFPKAWKDFR